jgi:sugar lactone lactonase YvrE
MSNNKDFKVKNGIQPTVYHEAVGTVVSDLQPYSISSLTSDNKSFSVQTQESNFQDFAFNTSGTKFYVIGHSTDAVHQYSMSTAWDISTASYDSKSFSVSSQDAVPIGIQISSDGTKVYVVGAASDTIYQYNLSTPFDASTGSYSGTGFSLSSQSNDPAGITFKTDGTKLYYLSASSPAVLYQYSLSTAWDLSTISYDSISHSFGNNNTRRSVELSSDGTKAIVWNETSGVFEEYSLSTAYDITTISSSPIATASSTLSTGRLRVKADGAKIYQINSSDDTIVQYSTVLTSAQLDLSTGSVFDYTPTSDVQVTLTNPAASGTSSGATLLLDGGGTTGYDLGNGAYSNVFFDGSGQSTSITKGELSLDGTKLYLFNGQNLYQYTLSTAFDLTSSSYDSVTFSFTSQSASNNGFRFKDDGTKLYLTSYTNQSVYQYSLSTAWDISTASYDSVSLSTSSQTTNPQDITFSSDGSTMYITSSSTFQYTLSTAWNISTASYSSKSLSHSSQVSPSGGTISANGSKFFIVGDSVVYEYTLSTAYDISTGSYASISFDATAQEGAIRGIRFSSDGKSMYLTGDVEDRFYQYSTATPATITYDSALQWSGGTAPTSPAIGETDVITFNTTDGGTTYKSALAIDGAK